MYKATLKRLKASLASMIFQFREGKSLWCKRQNYKKFTRAPNLTVCCHEIIKSSHLFESCESITPLCSLPKGQIIQVHKYVFQKKADEIHGRYKKTHPAKCWVRINKKRINGKNLWLLSVVQASKDKKIIYSQPIEGLLNKSLKDSDLKNLL